MNKFWQKQLPAFLLVMILLVGMMPAALAEEPAEHTHNWSTEWSRNSTKHWHECDGCEEKSDEEDHSFAEVSRREPTCYQDGEVVEECSVCKYQTTTTLSATGDHDYGTEWQKDGEYHWHGCTTKGCAAVEDKAKHTPSDNGQVTEPTCTAAGYITYTCDVCGGTYKQQTSAALGHNYENGKCTRCGASKPTTALTGKNISLSVTPSASKTVGGTIRTKISEYFGGSFSYVTFGSASGTAYGTLYANSGETSLSSRSYTYSTSGSYPLSSLYFVSTSRTGAYSVSYTAYDGSGNTVSGKVTIYVEGSSSSDTITYTVKPGKSVDFDADDFEAVYDAECSGTFRYVVFSVTSTAYSNFKGVVTCDGTDLSRSDFSGERFYYSSSSYGTAPISDLALRAPSNAADSTLSITFTAYGSGSTSTTGTLKLVVDGDGSGSTGITYTVKPGKSVDFDADDFEAAYDAECSGTFRYVTFSVTSSAYSNFEGVVTCDGTDLSRSDFSGVKFYYSSSSYGTAPISDLALRAPSNADDSTLSITYTAYGSGSTSMTGTLKLVVDSDGSSSGDIVYQLDPGEEISFDRTDFNKFFQKEDNSSYTIKYVTFSTSATLSTSSGTVYYNYGLSGEKAFSKTTIDDYKFYYSSSSQGDYALSDLSFVAPKGASKRTVEIAFTAYYTSTRKASGTLRIEIGGGSSSSKGDITYEVEAGKEKAFSRADFNKFFQEEANTSSNLKYVVFETDDVLSKNTSGLVYYDYGGNDEVSFDEDDISDYKFYYSTSDGDFDLSGLSFVASKNFSKAITLSFTAYYTSTKKASGTLVIQPAGTTTVPATLYLGDIVYYSTYNSSVQIKASDISRFFTSKYPTSTLQSVVLGGVPGTGSLYYNYFGTSKYGTSKLKLTAANCKQYTLYASPTTASQYALTELLYVPSGSNYCTSIPFTAYGSGGKSVSGVILISVSLSAVGEVYGVTPKNTEVSFQSSSAAIASAVASATGSSLASIQLLKLPAATVGTVYVGSGTSTKADTVTQYGYTTGTQRMSQLRFVPATGYTGSVELPYVAYDSAGKAIAAGKFCLGVVNSRKNFNDVTSSTWCYKYVMELADGKVIDGYTDGSFKPNNTITYGAALKLVMLAAGYPEQKPTGSNVFSGYLTKARAEGIITRTNVDLTKPITRLQVAQLAAGALKLDTTNLSTVQPFTDTTDASVRALNAAGIVEGYFSAGTSTYKPNNTLTRGQVSAIVWRMRNYQK